MSLREELLQQQQNSPMEYHIRRASLLGNLSTGSARPVVILKRSESSYVSRWRPPGHIRSLSNEEVDLMRKRKGILVEGDACPAPIGTFVVSLSNIISQSFSSSQEMKFPYNVIRCLEHKNIVKPTAIQMQGIPVA